MCMCVSLVSGKVSGCTCVTKRNVCTCKYVLFSYSTSVTCLTNCPMVQSPKLTSMHCHYFVYS